MGSPEVVFNEPFGQFLVENNRVRVEVTESDEFFLECPVETFVVRIVFWCPDTRVVLFDTEFQARAFEVLFKLCAIVVSNSRNLTIKEEMETKQKILPILRTLVLVHSGIGHFAILVDRGEDGSFDIVTVQNDGIQTDDEAGFLLVPPWFELGDTVFLRTLLLGSGTGCLDRMVVELPGFDDLLDFPGGDGFVVVLFVETSDLLLPIPDVLPSESEDTCLLEEGDLPLPHLFGSLGLIFEFVETVQVIWIEDSEPPVEGFS
jgi:hypothetical protein